MRIAPELWLKRLIIGGMDRIYELGQSFRNEGLDATHNPEFTTCEAYMAYGRLDDLIELTEKLFRDVCLTVREIKLPTQSTPCHALDALDADLELALRQPFRRLEFFPAMQEALGEGLPELERDTADAQLRELCVRHEVTGVGPSTSIPKMLDKLSEKFLQSQCYKPTLIMYPPACMSPLSKSTLRNGRWVGVRFELFVQEVELVNAYEEENNPEAQRRKFRRQQRAPFAAAHADETHPTDESYCRALEWGMPPTAGWGLGVDRMVMLFSGQNRIGHVLSFGGLRSVVNQGLERPVKDEPRREHSQRGGQAQQDRARKEEGRKRNEAGPSDVVGAVADSYGRRAGRAAVEGSLGRAAEEAEMTAMPVPVVEGAQVPAAADGEQPPVTAAEGSGSEGDGGEAGGNGDGGEGGGNEGAVIEGREDQLDIVEKGLEVVGDALAEVGNALAGVVGGE